MKILIMYKNMYMCIVDHIIRNIFYKDYDQRSLKVIDLVGVQAVDTLIYVFVPCLLSLLTGLFGNT